MYTISKQFHFCASHQIVGVPEGHPCGRLHGHNYVVELVLESPSLDECGFVVDYTALKPFQQWIDREWDHRHLNDVVDGPTTAENLARLLYVEAKSRWSQVCEVRVSETPRTWASYRESV